MHWWCFQTPGKAGKRSLQLHTDSINVLLLSNISHSVSSLESERLLSALRQLFSLFSLNLQVPQCVFKTNCVAPEVRTLCKMHKTCVYRCKNKTTYIESVYCWRFVFDNDWNKMRHFKCCHLCHNGAVLLFYLIFFHHHWVAVSVPSLSAVFLTLLESSGQSEGASLSCTAAFWQ